MEPDELLRSLLDEIEADRGRLHKLDRYYEGEQALRFIAPALQEEIGDRVTQLVINWPRLGVDAYENRLDVEGFRYHGDDSADDDLWDIWQANNMVEESGLAHLDALVFGRSYVIVGPGMTPDDPPIISVEHPLQVMVRRDPATRRATAAAKHWREDDDDRTRRATLYLPGSRQTFTQTRRGWEPDSAPVDTQVDDIPVVPLVNRRRTLRIRYTRAMDDQIGYDLGTSEFADIVPIADAANKMATDMMVSGEFHAMPRRYVLGMTEDDFVGESGKKVSPLEAVAGRMWGFAGDKDSVEVGQFTEADLQVFHNTIRLLAQVAAQMLGLAPHHMAFSSDNPASADAIRSSESIQVKRAERKQVGFGGSWEQVQRLALRTMGRDEPEARRLETQWRNPATPTVAQAADATVKLFQAGIISQTQALRDLGYTPEQIDRIQRDNAEAARRELLPFVQPAEPAA